MIFNVNKINGVEVKLVFEEEFSCEFLKNLKDKKLFEGKLAQIYYRFKDSGEMKIYLGLGKEKEVDLTKIRNTFFKLAKDLKKSTIEEICLNVPKINNLCSYKTALAIVEGMLYSNYNYSLSTDKKCEEKELIVNYNVDPLKEEKVLKAIKTAESIVKGVFLTRDLVNQPANIIYPETLAQAAKENLETSGVKVTIFNKDKIEEMNMQAFLSVSRASAKEPKLIIMEYYNDPESSEKVALVGKGVTYDSGGLAIKPTSGMVTMFCDMGGAGSVIGAIKALSDAKVKCNVVGVVAACENMINGDSYKNGDIISSMSGKTIEILNTDAEGRLTLADAVYYATSKLNVTKIIDIATLTGACVAALGERVSGVISNNCDFFNQLKEASDEADEMIHRFPINDYYKEMNKSEVADIKNTGGRYGGAITAGLFVGSFLAKEIPWIHIDIAGTAYISSAYDHYCKGATGVLVKTLFYLLSK